MRPKPAWTNKVKKHVQARLITMGRPKRRVMLPSDWDEHLMSVVLSVLGQYLADLRTHTALDPSTLVADFPFDGAAKVFPPEARDKLLGVIARVYATLVASTLLGTSSSHTVLPPRKESGWREIKSWL